jgi:signal transduction histidine kinase
MNLILNARDAGMQGDVSIKTEKGLLPDLQDNSSEKQYVCFSVADTGEGINQVDIRKIFDPFFTTKELGKGTGLGLSIVFSFKAHGGRSGYSAMRVLYNL